MPLTICTECEREVSDQAGACPGCGHPITTPLPDGEVSLEERRKVLANGVNHRLQMSGGWRVESEGDVYAVMVGGKPVNHILHLLLSVLTFGLWLIVWVFAKGETRYRLTVNRQGVGSSKRLR